MDKILRQPNVDEKLIGQLVNEFEKALILADVNIELVESIGQKIKDKFFSEEPPSGVSKRDYLIKLIYDELIELLGGEKTHLVWPNKNTSYVILLVGLQGSGKTSSAAKIAKFYAKRSYRVGLVAADTYRPGAQQQLTQLGEKIGVPVYTAGEDAVSIAKNGVLDFKQKKFNLIIVDTAGRHKEEKALFEEMREIASSINPDAVYLVLDATIGQLAGPQAAAFNRAVPVGYIVVTKLDGSARGGGALSAVAATGGKIVFVGTGEGIDDLEVFDPPSFISRLLGLGDIKALAERVAEAQLNEKQFEEIITSGKFTLADFEFYLDSISRMGSLSKLVTMIPGLSTIPSELMKNAEQDLKKWRVILNSFTKEEKLNPQLLTASRVRRIAIGSGTSQEDVRALLKRYEQMKSQMKLLKRNRALLKKLGSYKP
jgi:signal recognition particle subunit SRP54